MLFVQEIKWRPAICRAGTGLLRLAFRLQSLGQKHGVWIARQRRHAIASAFFLVLSQPLPARWRNGGWPGIWQYLQKSTRIEIIEPDEYAEFQSPHVVYHDDAGDYSTNEPTMDGTASLVYLLAAKEHEAEKMRIRKNSAEEPWGNYSRRYGEKKKLPWFLRVMNLLMEGRTSQTH